MKNHSLPEIVWHYTTGHFFLKIVESGFLLPTGIGVEAPEKPLLWFSKHPVFEPTARKGWREGGKHRVLSVQETRERGGGLVRFGIKPEALLHGNSLRAGARMSLKVWNHLERVAQEQGSTNRNWWGTTEALPINSMIIEVMDEDSTWKRVQGEGSVNYR
jgi:hypothetical protein